MVSFGIAKKAAEYYIEHDQQMIEQQQRTQNNIEESKYIHENVLNLGLKNPDYYDEYDNNIDNSNEKPKCNEYSNKENTNEEQKYDGYGNKIDNTYDEQKYYDYDERE